MSKILTKQEAEKIVKSMLDPLGFTVTILDYDSSKDSNEAYSACNSNEVTEKTGHLWWKKTIKRNKLVPVWSGWCWEDVIEKMDNWIKTKVAPRVVLAEKFRDEYAKKEADAALHDELSK